MHLLTITILSTGDLVGQEIVKCDVNVLGHTSDKLEKLTKEDVKNFLLTFDQSCGTAIEFSEWSNELLFDVLQKHPELMLRTLETEGTKIKKDAILRELSSQLLDKVNVNGLIKKVEQVNINGLLKKEVIDNLKKNR